jgi:2-haloalkanoic acid dehalogenase type II
VSQRYDAVLFDLLTALLDSWTLWNTVAGSESAGRTWRAAYLKLTYGTGAYRPYETLVREAAEIAGFPPTLADDLERRWDELTPWNDATATLKQLEGRVKLGVVTNCSDRLGRRAAARAGVPFDIVVTSERAGFYKPDPRPYRMALDELGVDPSRALFVAGSAYDLFGTSAVGLDTYWHNRVGLAPPDGAPPAQWHERTLVALPSIALS